jgi:hypothetical protein
MYNNFWKMEERSKKFTTEKLFSAVVPSIVYASPWEISDRIATGNRNQAIRVVSTAIRTN